MELTIVSTSLVTIANDLGDFSKSRWIIEAYMLTYVVRPGPPYSTINNQTRLSRLRESRGFSLFRANSAIYSGVNWDFSAPRAPV
jgi:hypothetical protein